MDYIKKPMAIEEESFRMIQEVIDQDYPDYEFENKAQEMVIKRCIHTSADFDYLENIKFTHGVLDKLDQFIDQGQAYKEGKAEVQPILYTDTRMALSGINKRVLDRFGIAYKTYVSDDKTFDLAEKKGITRSMAGVEIAIQAKAPKIFVFGNAPTGLLKLLELVEAGAEKPEAVVGAPVGFVRAAESKQALYESDLPAIVALGRKGGSNIAAAIINAVLYLHTDRRGQ